MADVAKIADVSMITVSRALRTPERVAPETRSRIEAAMAQIGYVPDLVAASLASRRSRVVAVVVPTIGSSIFSDTIEGMSDLLHGRGYQLIIGAGSYDTEGSESVITTLLSRRPDGLILTGSRHAKRARRMVEDFGEAAVTGFLSVLEDVAPERLTQLRRHVQRRGKA